MLKNPKVVHELANWRASKNITRDDFVDIAKREFDSIDDPCQANKPRYLDLIGKALKITTGEQATTTVNQTLNINVASMSLDELRSYTRKMIQDSSS